MNKFILYLTLITFLGTNVLPQQAIQQDTLAPQSIVHYEEIVRALTSIKGGKSPSFRSTRILEQLSLGEFQIFNSQPNRLNPEETIVAMDRRALERRRRVVGGLEMPDYNQDPETELRIKKDPNIIIGDFLNSYFGVLEKLNRFELQSQESQITSEEKARVLQGALDASHELHSIRLNRLISPEQIKEYLETHQQDPAIFRDPLGIMKLYTEMIRRLKSDWPEEGELSKGSIYNTLFTNMLSRVYEWPSITQSDIFISLDKLFIVILVHLMGEEDINRFGPNEQENFRDVFYEVRTRVIRRNVALSRVNISHDVINLESTDLRRADLKRCQLTGINLKYADLSNANLAQSELTNVNLDNTILIEADLSDARLFRCSLISSDLRKANSKRCHFKRSNLKYANLSEANLKATRFITCNLNRAILRSADLSQALIRYCQVFSTDLSHANLSGTDLKQIYFQGERTAQFDSQVEGKEETILVETDFTGVTFEEGKMTKEQVLSLGSLKKNQLKQIDIVSPPGFFARLEQRYQLKAIARYYVKAMTESILRITVVATITVILLYLLIYIYWKASDLIETRVESEIVRQQSNYEKLSVKERIVRLNKLRKKMPYSNSAPKEIRYNKPPAKTLSEQLDRFIQKRDSSAYFAHPTIEIFIELNSIFKHDPDPLIRAKSIDIYRRLLSFWDKRFMPQWKKTIDQHLKDIMFTLGTDKDPLVRNEALRALTFLNASWIDTFVYSRTLYDSNPQVRKEALYELFYQAKWLFSAYKTRSPIYALDTRTKHYIKSHTGLLKFLLSLNQKQLNLSPVEKIKFLDLIRKALRWVKDESLIKKAKKYLEEAKKEEETSLNTIPQQETEFAFSL